MKQYLILALVLLYSVNCELNYLPETFDEEVEKTFLQQVNLTEEKGKVVIVLNCDDSDNSFTNSKTKVNPIIVTKGETIQVKVQGTSDKDIDLSKLSVVASLNGVEAFNDSKSLEGSKIVANQPFTYDYQTTVPTFIPEGRFDIKMFILNTEGKKVSCLDAYFDE